MKLPMAFSNSASCSTTNVTKETMNNNSTGMNSNLQYPSYSFMYEPNFGGQQVPYTPFSPFCYYCWNAGEPTENCAGHFADVNCPRLRNALVTRCIYQGDMAYFVPSLFCSVCKEYDHEYVLQRNVHSF